MANGDFAGGSGTEGSPYLIEDVLDLDAIRNNLRAHYKLVGNIDLDTHPFNEGEGWRPIPRPFMGSIDGGGFSINNLFINRPGINMQALVEETSGASIKNIVLKDVFIIGGTYVGGIVSRLYSNSVVKNCFISGHVESTSESRSAVGSVAGSFFTDSSIINVKSLVDVKGVTQVSGVVGSNTNRQGANSIKNTIFLGTVTGNKDVKAIYNKDKPSLQGVFYNEEKIYDRSQSSYGKTIEQLTSSKLYEEVGYHKEKTASGEDIWIIKEGHLPRMTIEGPPPKSRFLFLREGVVLSPKNIKGKNLVNYEGHLLESDNTKASSYYSSSYKPHNAFNGDVSGSTRWRSSNNKSNEWLQYSFTYPERVSKYVLYPYRTTSYSPRNWTLEGSNDEVNWHTLDTRNNITSWEVMTPREFSTNSNNKYKHYRVNIKNNNGGTAIAIAEMEFYKDWGTVTQLSLLDKERAFVDYGLTARDTKEIGTTHFNQMSYVQEGFIQLDKSKVFSQGISSNKTTKRMSVK